MQATVENISNLERRMTVALPAQLIEAEISERLTQLSRTAKMSGFRPGKVPLKIVEKQYGQQVRQEVISSKVEETFSDAVEKNALRIAGYPSIEPKPFNEGAENYEYVATFEIFPEVKIGDLSATKVERPKVKVVEADVDTTLKVLQKQRATFDPADRGAEIGDNLTIELITHVDGDQLENTDGQTLSIVLGEPGRFDGFDEQLIGIKAGETRNFELTFPNDYHNEVLAGKTASYEVRVNAVAVPKLPKINADFARDLGVEDGDVKKMRSEIKDSLVQEVDKRIKSKVKDQVMEALVNSTEFDLPKSLISSEIGRLMDATRKNMEERQIDLESVNMEPSMFEAQAKHNVKLRLILMELVRINKLQAKPEQVRAVIDDYAKNFNQPEEVVAWFYADPKRLEEPSSSSTEENVVAWVLERVKVVDKISSFDELMDRKSV